MTDLSLNNAKTEVSAYQKVLLKYVNHYHMGIVPLSLPGCVLDRLLRSKTIKGRSRRLVGRSGPSFVVFHSTKARS
jgi:hypothetical protein